MTVADFELLEKEFGPYLVGSRTGSTAMLAWFLEHVWRIEPEEAEDALCDGSNDKGIDAIVVDDDAREIAVVQGKRRRSPERTQGNADLERLRGIDTYFRGPEGIDALLESSPSEELRLLIERLGVRRLLDLDEPYTVRLVAVTNAERDAAAEDYLASNTGLDPSLELWDRQPLAAVARRTRRPGLLAGNFTLPPAGDVLRQPIADGTSLVFALIPANELVRLPGISDLTLFALNVRLGLGRTRINKELARTVREEQAAHRLFPAYHNGLTLLTERLDVDDEGLRLEGVSVVNGCQSLLALHANQDRLTPELTC
jgi:hypothetical protein